MTEIALRVDGLSKQYRIGAKQEKYQTFRDSLTRAVASPFRRARSLMRGEAYGASGLDREIWALKEVSFEIEQGEVVGVIGRNGAGKSTLLKILSSITEPSAGYVDIWGRVGSLLEVGTGFHPELTGRENVYLNGAILGMSRLEVDRKFDAIVDFAEVDQFIDTPVKHYSSGMGLRLGFAVAAYLEPDILIVDEVLAVGDASFQQKCIGKMSEVANGGRTVFFVSHNLSTVQALCTRALLLERGQVSYDGTTSDAISKYLQSANSKSGEVNLAAPDVSRRGTGQARYTSVRLMDTEGSTASTLMMGQPFAIEACFECERPLKNPNLVVKLSTALNVDLIAWRTQETAQPMGSIERGGCFRLKVEDLRLLPGLYFLTVAITNGHELLDLVEKAVSIEVVASDVSGTGKTPSSAYSIIFTPCSWSYDVA